MSWDKDRVERIRQDVVMFLKDLFKKETHSLEDAKLLSDIIATQMNSIIMAFSLGFGVGLEQQEEIRRKTLERLQKKPFYTV